MLANPWATPDPNQAPGFNVQPEQPAPANPMASLLASFMPSGETWKQGVADTLGAPVDALAWALHRMGAPISGDKFYGGGTFNRAPGSGEPTWTPSPSVPFGSQNFRNVLDNPPACRSRICIECCAALGCSRRRMMARTAAEQDLDTFMSMINQNCAAKLAELDREAFVAKCLPPDDAVAEEHCRAPPSIDRPAGHHQAGTRDELAAQWPADFPPLSWAFVTRNDFALALGLPPDLF